MRLLRLWFPAGALFLICPVCAATGSAVSPSESTSIALARGIEEEPESRQEPSYSAGALSKGAGLRYSDSQTGMEADYLRGGGVPQNHVEAMSRYWRAAAQGNADAQLNLGTMYSEVSGVTRVGMEAARWSRKAVQSNRSLRIRLVLSILGVLILPPFVIAALLLIVSRNPLHRSLSAAGIPEHLERAGSVQVRDSDIIAELEHLQSKRTRWTSWVSTFLVLMISVALFIAVEAGTSSWELLIMIVGILFLHEAGHYIAMRVFHYRNVRMFFIPFFGAAVSGRNYAVPGWKKAIVALMGPLPGILLGSALGLAGFIRGSEWMAKIAMTAVILNGFQLLPVLPLDGGQVMHALPFGRNHWFDAVFRVLAAGAVAGAGLLSGDKISLFLGLLLLAGVSSEYKTARIAVELRRQGIDGRMPAVTQGCESVTLPPAMSPPAPQPVQEPAGLLPMTPPTLATPASKSVPAAVHAEEDWIPQTVAGKIIERVKACFPQVTSPRQVARLTLRVYGELATRPPGIWASIGFACLHYALFIIALVSLLLVR